MKQQHLKKQLIVVCQKSTVEDETNTVHRSLFTVHRQNGFTLIELLIAVTIAIIIIGATYATYISQQRSFTAQDQVSEMTSTSKVALDMIVNDIREAGFGVPDDLSSVQRVIGCPGINGYTERVTLQDGVGAGTTDVITIVGGFRLVGNINANYTSGSTTLVLTDTGIVNNNDKSYISIGGMTLAIVSSVDSSTTLTLQSGLNKSYPVGVPVYLVENRTYSVTVAGELQRTVRDSGNAGCITSPDGPDTIAENIEDLQIAFEVDTNGDGIPDAFRYDVGNIALGAGDVILRIRVNLLAQTARPDPNFLGQGNPPNSIENRDLSALLNDNLRRRWWQMQVDPRNPI